MKTVVRWISLIVLFVTASCSLNTSSNHASSHAATSNSSKVRDGITQIFFPGQQIWKSGVSSFLFGTNDSQEWASNNIETEPGIQKALKDAHFTLMRTFFFDKSLADGHLTTDAEIETRIQTVENSGMTCLGVLPDIYNLAFDKHLLTLLGNRCNIYEFGNEPDYNGIAVQNYIAQWNLLIPQLRKINPLAKFIGGAGAQLAYTQKFLQGVKASGVIPDAIDIHWYPCWEEGPSTCLPKANSIIQIVLAFRAMIQSTLGFSIPVGVGEWNMDSGSNFTLGYNDAFMSAFTKAALDAMIQLKVSFANQFEAANYGGYGALDMFHLDKPGFPPKVQYYVMKSIISEYMR